MTPTLGTPFPPVQLNLSPEAEDLLGRITGSDSATIAADPAPGGGNSEGVEKEVD